MFATKRDESFSRVSAAFMENIKSHERDVQGKLIRRCGKTHIQFSRHSPRDARPMEDHSRLWIIVPLTSA